ncbi:MAG: MBOAT family O-acyltransferase [Brevefilum sp.]|nr:MBOAT family O-acyltransferase [Brevefilum sp.]
MPFSSITFIFLFLPITLIAFYVLPRKGWRNLVLVLTSLVFFAWSDPTHIHILFLSIIINYLWGCFIGKAQAQNATKSAKTQMWIGILLNLGLLGFYKYTGFFLDILNSVLPISIDYAQKALPLGISFFTFSGISYILDIYNEIHPPEKNLVRFSSYLIMFPKLVQGPITRFIQVKDELLQPKFIPLGIMEGVRRFIGGLAKKVILADSLGMATNKVFATEFNEMGAGLAWFGLIAYTLQIYLDFSGYTDMAIGVGQMLGFKLPENFNFPYISRSISDFWRRWHITLGAWFRTYLFIPLEFARKKAKNLRQQSNLMIVFLLTGLWHGASWNFVIWGAYYGLILAIEASGFSKMLKKAAPFFQYAYAIILIMIGWIFFRITDVSKWGSFFSALFGANGWTNLVTFRSLNILFYLPFLIPAILLSLPFFHQFGEKIKAKGGKALLVLDIGYIALFLFTITFILSKGFTAFMYVEF